MDRWQDSRRRAPFESDLIIEPSAAVPVAALLDPDLKLPGKKIGVILSGGNVDLDRLPWAGDSIPVSIG